METKEAIFIFSRYLFLAILGIFIKIFYMIFHPLTLYTTYFIISRFVQADIFQGKIFFSGVSIELIEACIAGAAYYLLIILNLSTPMRIKKRILSLIFLIGGFFILNLIRILIFSGLLAYDKNLFDKAHTIVWNFGSTILLVILWFITILIFKIKEIPVYSDFKKIYENIK